MLSRSGFVGSLYVVVPHEEVATYVTALNGAPVHCILIGAQKGLVHQRKHARSLFPGLTEMVFVDDDVTAIKMKLAGQYSRVGNIHAIVDYCFEWLSATNSVLWGVYPIANGLFMKERLAVGNCYVVGAFYGIINDNRLKEPEVDECEDLVRQLSEQAAGRPPLRFDCFGIETRYFKNAGGMQQDRKKEVRESVVATLVDNYSSIVKLKRRKEGQADVAFLQRPEYRVLMAAQTLSTVPPTGPASPSSEPEPHVPSDPPPH